jgi:hypothetical protein
MIASPLRNVAFGSFCLSDMGNKQRTRRSGCAAVPEAGEHYSIVHSLNCLTSRHDCITTALNACVIFLLNMCKKLIRIPMIHEDSYNWRWEAFTREK